MRKKIVGNIYMSVFLGGTGHLDVLLSLVVYLLVKEGGAE